MPEMLKYCGKRFRVQKQAHKTCDTIRMPRSLRMSNAVHLENVRCDGAAHGGCQAGCLIFWKEAWLKQVGDYDVVDDSASQAASRVDSPPAVCTEDTVMRETRQATEDPNEEGAQVFSCQATELPKATSPIAWWDLRQYLDDLTSGNVRAVDFARGISIAAFNMIIRSFRRSISAIHHSVVRPTDPLAPTAGAGTDTASSSIPSTRRPNSIVDYAQHVFTNSLVEYPHVRGTLAKTPSLQLNLQPGELVQVRSKAEIMATLDRNNRNRGLFFDVEMVPYCSGFFRVQRRVERIVNEKTGRMLSLPNPCIVLEGVVCGGCLSRNRLFCPRNIPSYWHEIWLRRTPDAS